MIKATRILLAIMFALSLSLVSMGVAQADYNNPPGWDSNPYFTHQTWDFLTADNPSAPTVDNNPFGTAEYISYGFEENPTWHATYEGRIGVWEFDENSYPIQKPWERVRIVRLLAQIFSRIYS
ncbi:MAG: hypothetical protein JJV92_03410 [Desulfosarcina sp.]|nr:hypothetical protein [Desulfobacterales bacterium]